MGDGDLGQSGDDLEDKKVLTPGLSLSLNLSLSLSLSLSLT